MERTDLYSERELDEMLADERLLDKLLDDIEQCETLVLGMFLEQHREQGWPYLDEDRRVGGRKF